MQFSEISKLSFFTTVKCNYKNSRKIVIDNTEMKDISDTHISGTINNTLYLFART